MAHRRLAIIDLATGRQPMLDASGSTALVFNGEIYNYLELRKDLEKQGFAFRTNSDTEVLLHSYEQRSADCVDDLRGMFAFAIWDDATARLLLARDRIGKKPLYYVVEDDCLYFASSLHALRQTSPRRWAIDVTALDAFLTVGYVPAPLTIYKGVLKLEAGTIAMLNGDALHTHRYWDLAKSTERFDGPFLEAVDRLDELLNAAVSLRLRSDVPLGVFLSGGVDSSLVTAVARRQSSVDVATFSIGFDEVGFDESAYAARVAGELGTRHHSFRVRPDLLRTLPEMVRHFGEPFADSAALALWLLSQETRKHVTVALGGDGGDEAFGGYDWYRTATRIAQIKRAVPATAVALAGKACQGILRTAISRRPAARFSRRIGMLQMRDAATRYAAIRSIIGAQESEMLYDGALREHRNENAAGSTGARLTSLYRESVGSDLRRMRYVDIATYLADCMMPKVDVTTMAHGLEARAPLLDQELLRFALTLPDEWLIDRGGGKRILRAVLARYLSPVLFERPKHGFNMPLAQWFMESHQSAISALASSEPLVETGLLKPSGIKTLAAEHSGGYRDHSERLFVLFVLDAWLKVQ
jgi:asparagine synthase (glutamine-hydrolysing)